MPSPDQFSAPAPIFATGWRCVHIGFANDGLTIGGIEIWRHEWRPVATPRLVLPHPTYPDQAHDFEIYAIGDGAASLRFAASEVSNGVWGFYVPDDSPADDPKVAQGAANRLYAPDGLARVDIDWIEWRHGQWIQSPRVTAIASERVILDLWNSDWDASVSFPAQGGVRLDLQRVHYGGDLAVVLDLAEQRYRIVREPGKEGALAEGPLDGVVAAIEAAAGRSAAYRLATADPALRPVPIATHPPAAWRQALVILAVAIGVIAAATWLSLHFAPPPKQRILTPIPTPTFAPRPPSPVL